MGLLLEIALIIAIAVLIPGININFPNPKGFSTEEPEMTLDSFDVSFDKPDNQTSLDDILSMDWKYGGE